MRALFVILSVLFVFFLNVTNLDDCIKKVFIDNTSVECGDFDNAENDTEEKGKEEDKESDFNDFYCKPYELTTTFSPSSKKIKSASRLYLNAEILLESPPPKS